MSDTTNTYRARIVEALRAEADRIEAGGKPECYAINLDGDVEEYASVLYAHQDTVERIADAVADAEGGTIVAGIDNVQWGVMVPVEVAEVIAHARDLRGEASDVIVEYGLVLVGKEVERGIVAQDCPECGEEVKVAPGERCPFCEDNEAMEIRSRAVAMDVES